MIKVIYVAIIYVYLSCHRHHQHDQLNDEDDEQRDDERQLQVQGDDFPARDEYDGDDDDSKNVQQQRQQLDAALFVGPDFVPVQEPDDEVAILQDEMEKQVSPSGIISPVQEVSHQRQQNHHQEAVEMTNHLLVQGPYWESI